MMRTARVFALGLTLAWAAGALAQTPGGAPDMAPGAAHGQSLFEDRCGMCHVLGGVGQGPDLVGVVGRKAGSAANFNFTAALTASGLTWTAPNLDRFLTDPRTMVPGTAMRARLPSASDRRDLIAYLNTLNK